MAHIIVSFQKIYTFSRLFLADFVLLYIVCQGRSKFCLLSKAICVLKG